MSPDNPLFLVFFFGIFHGFGGLAFGKGLRDTLTGKKNHSLLLWGVIIGIIPILFDWAFLYINWGINYAIIGPIIFIVAAIVSGIFYKGKMVKVHEKSIGAILAGGITLAFGFLIAPYLVKQALTIDLRPEDYVFGSCLLVLPFLVGFAFLSNGLKAITKNKSFDEHIAEQEKELEDNS